MNRLFSTFLGCCILTLSVMFFSGQALYANIYAAQLKITNPDGSPFDGNFSDGSDARLSFFLNDDATTVFVNVVDAQSGSVVYSISAGALSRGANLLPWDGTGAVDGNSYTFRVIAEQPNASTTDWSLFYDSGDINIFTRGMAVNTNMKDPHFGLTFTSNDGGPLETGINIYNADGSFHNPFLVAADIADGGTIDYGSDAPIFAVLDYMGRIYVSLKSKGQVLRINRDFSADTLIDGLSHPKGLYVEGEGANFTIYVAADNQVLRATIGMANSVTPGNMELVGDFSAFVPQQIMLDNDGDMYATLRANNDLGSDGRGIRKFDISGTLPVTDNDASWFLFEDKTFIANDLLLDPGADPNSAVDDELYYCTRAGSGQDQDGIWKVDDIHSFFPDTVRIMTESAFYGSDANVNARASIDFDPAGNIVFTENSNEHIFFISPPGTGATNNFTTTSTDTVTINMSVGIDDGFRTFSYQLEGNYPNPFNPNTTIKYQLGNAGQTRLDIFNIQGQLVKTLVNHHQPAGAYQVNWDGRNQNGDKTASGVYIMTLRSGKFIESKRMTLLK